MTTPQIDTIVRELAQAHRSGSAWQAAPFEQALDVADAYRIQDAVAAELGWFADGRVPAWKAGGKGSMTAAPLPVLLASGATWHPGATQNAAMEAEVGFRLASTPGHADEVLDCIGSMCVTIEMVGTRMVGGMLAPPAWKTADQQLHGVLVAGTEMAFAPRDWATQAYTVQINGETRADARGTHPNGNAVHPLPWLFEHAHARGRSLRAGDLASTGAWVVIKVQPGDLVEVAFAGIGAAAVRIATA